MNNLQIDRQKLADFLAKNIDHHQNPEFFNQQMEAQISRHLRSHQDHLKQLQSKMKIKQIEESEMKVRESLRKKLEEKSKQGAEKKIKIIEERVKSMAALRHRKQEYMAQKMAVSRKQSLKQSLQKIKDYEEKTSRIEHALANKSASESKLFLTSESRVHKKKEYLNTEYENTVQKLKQKGIFDLPDKHKLNQLYAKKVKFVKEGFEKKKQEDLNKIGETLEKINEARKKKEKLMSERTDKLRNIEKYQQQLKGAKFDELKKLQRQKIKKIEKKLSEKISQVHTNLENMSNMNANNNHNIYESRKQETQGSVAENLNKHSTYKHEIRKHIESFMKQQGALK